MVAPSGIATGVSEEVADWIITKQRRCVECGSTFWLEIHHRISRGEGEIELQKFLRSMVPQERFISGKFVPWHLHDVQNLVLLCKNCHERIDLDRRFRDKYRNTFTCPRTGFNISLCQF